MARTCSVCAHPGRMRIDGAIVEGMAHRDIARQFGLGRNAIDNHAEKHLPQTLTRAAAVAEVAHADDLLAEVRKREQRADHLGKMAEQSGDFRTALQALREWRGLAEFRAKVAGELDERAVVNISLNPEWHRVRAALLLALEDFPDARMAVAIALRDLEGSGSHDGR